MCSSPINFTYVMEEIFMKKQPANFLKRVYEKPTDRVPQKQLYCCVDPGSTQIRTVAQYVNSDNEIILASEGRNAISTNYVNILNSMNKDTSKEPLWKNMEFSIQYPAIPGITSKPKLVQFARGRIADMYRNGSPTLFIDSTTEKGRQMSTYNGILSNLALYCLGDDMYTNTYADVYNIDLCLAIPPMELSLSTDSTFQSVLCGREWEISLPRVHRTFKMIINNLQVVEEPVAAATSAIGRSVVSIEKNVSFLDCGGRSIGWVPRIGRVCQENVYSHQGDAGLRFLSYLAEEIKRIDNVAAPTHQEILSAMENGGKLMIGAKEASFIQAYNNALRYIAQVLIGSLRKGIANSSNRIETFQEHIFSGRIFTNPIKDSDGNIISDQLIDVLYEEFVDLPEGVQLRVNPTNNPILDGLSLIQTNYMLTSLFGEDEEEEDKEEDDIDEF